MSEAQSLTKTLQSIEQSILNVREYAETNVANPNIPLEDVRQRIDRLETMLNKYLEVENKLFRHDAAQDSKYPVMEEIYYSAMSCLNKMVPNRRQSVQSNTTNNAFDTTDMHNVAISHRPPPFDIKLPKITVPQFSGNYMEWQSFFELFCKQVHEREGLSDAQRLQYLKCYLSGEAQSLIMHMSITDANYSEALAKLKGRYDKRRYTINAFIQKFMDQPVIQHSNVNLIKKLYDVSDGVIRGMKALGSEAESRDPWLIYVILTKLDVESRTLWAQETKNVECPTLEKLLNFLTERIDTLETFGMNKKSALSHKSPAIKSYATSVAHCSLCKEENFHKLYECKSFKTMNQLDRLQHIKKSQRCFNCLNSHHSVYECKFKSRCQICHRKHHTLLHGNSSEESTVPDKTVKDSTNTSSTVEPIRTTTYFATSSGDNSNKSNCLSLVRQIPNAMLPTVMVKLRDRHGHLHKFRALLDSGSESNFITEKCIKKLQLSRSNDSISIRGLGHSDIGRTKGSAEIELSNMAETYKTRSWSYVVPRISSVSTKDVAISHDVNKINQIQLADPMLFESGDIDVLCGVNIFFDSLDCTNKIEFANLSAYNTKFGWIIIGNRNAEVTEYSETFNAMLDVDTTLKQFWEIESIPAAKELTPEEEVCESLYQDTTVRGDDGKFVVRLPAKGSFENLGSSYHIALQSLKSMERRFSKDNTFKELYFKFMEEYEALGHMTLIGDANKEKYYMPHHGVTKESSTTKLRVVFDASAKSTTNISLNDLLEISPSFQSSLIEILLRFRQHKYVLTGDIEKMYRMVWIHSVDAKSQRILWRTEPTMTPKEYRLNTVTYGTAPAAYLATRSLKEVSLRFKNANSDAAKVLLRDVYVDDVMTGSSNIDNLISTRDEIISNLKMYGFNLRKLRSNVPKIITSTKLNFESVAESVDKTISECPEIDKVLGMIWDSASDEFSFQFNFTDVTTHTKRSLLSESSKIFDPLGLLTPITIKLKIIFQSLWLSSMKWDDELPEDVKAEWLKIRRSFSNINTIKTPRWLNIEEECILHGFSDASEVAYAACIYAVTYTDGTSVSRLIVAKSKVAPIKQISLPRLELQAALLLAKLMSWVEETITVKPKEIVLWTDSKIVLDWLSSHPRRWKTFIANRTSEILETYKFKREAWNHIKSEYNAANCSSRGLYLEQLTDHHLWWTGPHWLTSGERRQTKFEVIQSNQPHEEEQITTSLACVEVVHFLESLIQRHSSFYRACRALAKATKYIEKLKTKIHPQLVDRYNPHILPKDIRAAEVTLCKYIQKTEFAEEYTKL